MSNIISKFEEAQNAKLRESKGSMDNFKSGDTVRVNYKIREGKTERIQAFEGVVIGKRRAKEKYDAIITIRKMASGVGVERTFVLSSPLVDSIKRIKQGVVRRGKLYYMRGLTGKAARIKEKIDFRKKSEIKKEEPKAKVVAEEKTAEAK